MDAAVAGATTVAVPLWAEHAATPEQRIAVA